MKVAVSTLADVLLVLAILVAAWGVVLFLGGAVAHLTVYVAELMADVVQAGWGAVA